MDVENLAKELILKNMTPEQQMAVLDSVRQSVAQAKEVQKRKIGENVDLVVQALKKIESDIRSRFDDVGNAIEKRVSTIQDGRDGADGKDGRDGKDGKNGRDGAKGDRGERGQDGRDGVDGVDGVSVSNARIDFDGSLIITLSSGIELNVGEVVAPDLAERIKVITNGGGTSQSVLDTLASLQTQITNLIPSQTGNSGKYLTTNGTSTSWASIAGGGLSYQGTWNASTNTPTLVSSTGVNGYYYITATAGSTNLDGITDWQIGDWLLFNGTVWQKIDQSETLQSITSTDGSVTVTTTGSTADLSVAVAASTTNVICYVRNATGATLTKGTAVYINGATGQNPTVTKAQANNDTNSAQTLGLMSADLANNSNGYVTIIGLITNINTSAFTDGEQLYLSPTTAGALTATKPYAPNHLVYVAIVEHAHPTQGKLFVKIQNGYEMDELHNVSAQNPTNGQVLIYNESTSLWEKQTLTDGTGISITEGAGSITIANSGVTAVSAGTGISVSGSTGSVTITNSSPDQTVALTGGTGISTSGTYPNFTITNSAPDQTVALTGAGTTSISGTYPNFTITSNDAYTGTVTSVSGTSPVSVATGTTTPVISLAANYGDTQNPYASKTANYVLAAPNGSSGAPTFRAIVAADIPTLNQNTTGSAATVTTTINSGVVATTQTAGDNSTKVATTAYVNAITGTSGITGFKNRIINGDFKIAQRGTSFTSGSNSDDTYNLDRWYVLSDGNDIVDITQTTTVPTGAQNSIGLDVETINKKFGIAQIIEASNCYDAIGGNVTLSFQAKVSSLTKLDNVKCAIVAWSGTADTVTSDIISAWGVEGTNPTLIANATYENTPANLNVTTSFASYSVTANVDTASTKNIILFIWSDVTDTTLGDFLHITNVQLEKGSTATSFDYRPYGTELQLAQRYYQTSYTGVGVAVPTNSSGGYIPIPSASVANGSQYAYISFKQEMRASPTVTTYSYTSSTTSVVSNLSGSDLAASSGVPTGSNRNHFWLTNSSGGAITPAIGGFLIHFAATSEL